MANTVIALKKSATPSSVPSNLANGELAINYADGKLYYKAANGTIASISSGTNSFGTVNANNTLVVADVPGGIFSIVSGNNIAITGDAVNDKVTVGLTNDVNIPGKMNVASDFTHTGGVFYINNGSGAGGTSEGGEIQLANATQNQVLSGRVSIDIYENKLRFFETNSPNRGAFINIASASAGVGTDLLATASATDSLARATASQAFDKANNALANTNGITFGGTLNVSQNVAADKFIGLNNGNGENFKVGDDAWLGDTNLGNTVRLKGQQNTSHGYILFGPNDGKLLGRAGTDNLTYDGNTVWHAGIDGAGSGLDADLLDGQHGSYYGIASDVTAAFSKANSALSNTSGSTFNGDLFVPGLYAGNFAATSARMRLIESGNISYIQSGTSTLFTGRPIHFTPYFSASATMVVDVANVRVGINRTDPSYSLDIFGTANAANILINGNMVGTVGGIAAAFASANAGQATANAAFDAANTATALGTAARSIANLAFIHANNAFANANTVMISAQAAFTVANSSFLNSNAAYAFANSIAITANLAFAHANSAYANGNVVIQTAQSAFTQANAALASASAGQSTANAAFNRANTANITADRAWNHANAAFDTANNALPKAGGTITGNLAISGSLTVSGNVFMQDTETLRIADPLLYLAGNNYSSDIVDIGFVANYVNATGSNVHTGLFRDATSKEYYIFEGYEKETNTNHKDSAGKNFTISTLNATLKTSNLILGGTNTIPWITASFGQANAALASASAGQATGNAAFASANAGQATANAAFARANTANITADRAWNHANAAFGIVNTAVQNTATVTFVGTSNNSLYAYGKQENQLSVASAATLTTARLIGDTSFNGSADIIPSRITYKDTRSVDFAPITSGNTGLTLHLKTNATDGLNDGGTYHGILHLQQWSDLSGGNPHQLGFTDNGNVYLRTATNATAWGTWREMWHDANDGAGSGLDADLLDGQQGTYYGIASDVTSAFGKINVAFANANTVMISSQAAFTVANSGFIHANAAFTKANAALANTSGVSFNGSLNFPTGNVGIGLSAPAQRLHIYGTDINGILRFGAANTLGAGSRSFDVGIRQHNTVVYPYFGYGIWDTSGDINVFYIDWNTKNTFLSPSAGNVGVGTLTPGAKLTVYGNMRGVGYATDGTTGFEIFDANTGGNHIGSMTRRGNGIGISSYDFLSFYTAATAGISGGTERMRVSSTGNVSIGTTTQYSRLTVSNGGSTRSGITISDGDTASLMMFAGASQNAVISTDAIHQALIFKRGSTVGTENGTETMRLDASGNVLIGRTDSTVGQRVKLDVNGAVNASAVLVNGAPISGSAYYSGNNGDVGSSSGLGDIFRVHTNTLNANVTIYSGNNALAAGPITIASGRVLTIQANARISIV